MDTPPVSTFEHLTTFAHSGSYRHFPPPHPYYLVPPINMADFLPIPRIFVRQQPHSTRPLAQAVLVVEPYVEPYFGSRFYRIWLYCPLTVEHILVPVLRGRPEGYFIFWDLP
uniref:Uncharacterized protein n=1 Tax=Cannabis sativa TaxID=3483 RepID=A0A803P0F1_CANSA